MSQKILKALMQLFAIIANPQKGQMSRRPFVEFFLKEQLNKELVEEYLKVFDKYYSEYQKRQTKSKKIKVISVSCFESKQISATTFNNTVLQGDLAGKYSVSEAVFQKPIYESIKSPKTYFLPVRFSFSDGIRKVAERRSFTFVGDVINLNRSIECFQIKGENIELYSI